MADNAGESSRTEPLEGKTQTGSVIEFAFVNNGLKEGKGLKNGYIATSYPYPLPKERHEKRYIARENLPRDMDVFLNKNIHAYVVNVSANAFNCWIIVYWTKYGEYDEYKGGRIGQYPEILNRLNDFQNKNRGKVRSTAFGSGKETCFLRASDGQHQWSFRWKDLPFDCEMKVQDSIQQSGWVDRRPEIEGKEPLERVQYYRLDPDEKQKGKATEQKPQVDANKRAAGCIRFLTLAKNDAWIIYGETWHIWDEREGKLPQALVEGLEIGRDNQWIINKVELSLFNEEEYVLVYDEGAIFYNILSPTFVEKFKRVVDEWARSKERTVYYNEEVIPERIPTNRAPCAPSATITSIERTSSQSLQTHQTLLGDTASAISRQPSSNYDLVSEHTSEQPPEARPPDREQIDTEPGETEDESLGTYDNTPSRRMSQTPLATTPPRSIPPLPLPPGQRPIPQVGQAGRGREHRRNTGSGGMKDMADYVFKKFRG